MQVNKIKMRQGRLCSYNPLDIQGVYVDNIYHDVEDVYDYIIKTGQKIYVNGSREVHLISVIALNGKRYIRSTPNKSFVDDLLKLPRE